MGGVANSVGGFLGLSSGPQAPTPQTYSSGLDQLNNYNNVMSWDPANKALQDYSTGNITSDQALQQGSQIPNQWEQHAFNNELATDATTGSKYATEQVQNNPILGGLFGKGGQLNQAEDKLTQLNNQGFQLTPDDQTLYGQTSGNIARQFGQQGNQISQDLASRGLASAPSGAAGAMFSGLAGNQNEMLQNAQQQIMQQRVQNTLQQIGQQQQFVQGLGGQGANAIQNQFGRQLAGAQNQVSNLATAGGLQTTNNNSANSANMNAAGFNASHTPANFMDYTDAGIGSSLYNVSASPGTASQTLASGGGTGANGKSSSLFAGMGAGA